MKPVFEKVSPSFGSSFTYQLFEQNCPNSEAFWHFHPELEIVYLPKGKGKRHIGNHISYFKNGDLILIGSNLPHLGYNNRLQGASQEVVVQMQVDFLGKSFLDIPEMATIQQLFQRAKQGLSFTGDTREKVGKKLLQMAKLKPFERLVELLEVLSALAHSDDFRVLNAEVYSLDIDQQDQERINTIYKYVYHNFQEVIPLEAIAKEVNMTIPAFCRYFKKVTNRTFTQFVNEYRIVQACRLLAEEQLTIAAICYECGFNNLSHFNKHFKQRTGKSPSDYRKEFRQIIGV